MNMTKLYLGEKDLLETFSKYITEISLEILVG